jgi:ribonuclease Z
MLRVTFIGTSAGIPSAERGMPAVAVKYESELMLWDCGEGTQRQLMRYKVGYGSVTSIFITHFHLDHYLGAYGLLETLNMLSASPRQLSVFAPKDVRLQDYKFVKMSKMRKGKLYEGNGFKVSAFPVKHSTGSYGLVFQEDDRLKFHEKKAKGLGLRGRQFKEIQKKGSVKTAKGSVKLGDVTWSKPGRKIVYSGDCAPDDNTIEAAKGADLLIHEGTFDASMREEAAERLHSTVEDAAMVAKRAKAKRLVITHISSRYADTSLLLEQAKKIFPASVIAEDGLSVDL